MSKNPTIGDFDLVLHAGKSSCHFSALMNLACSQAYYREGACEQATMNEEHSLGCMNQGFVELSR